MLFRSAPLAAGSSAQDLGAEAPAGPAAPAAAQAAAAEPLAQAAAAPAPSAAEVPAEPALGAQGYDAKGRPGRIHVVVRGDTLWDVSEAYLGTPWVWPAIWKDNDAIANPHRIYPGDRIWISPWEMRVVDAEEAARLLGGHPAAPAPEAPLAAEPSPPPRPVFHRESAEELVGLVSEEEIGRASCRERV